MKKYKRLTILVDMDEIVADLYSEWLSRYNEKWDDNLTKDDILTWETHKYVKPECGKKIYSFFRPDMFDDLEVIPGSKQVLGELNRLGHKIVFVTASPRGCADAKCQWAVKNFKFIDYPDIITAKKKYLVQGDVFIDDAPHNIREYRYHHPKALICTMAYAYNEEVAGLANVREDWKDPKAAWATFGAASRNGGHKH